MLKRAFSRCWRCYRPISTKWRLSPCYCERIEEGTPSLRWILWDLVSCPCAPTPSRGSRSPRGERLVQAKAFVTLFWAEYWIERTPKLSSLPEGGVGVTTQGGVMSAGVVVTPPLKNLDGFPVPLGEKSTSPSYPLSPLLSPALFLLLLA